MTRAEDCFTVFWEKWGNARTNRIGPKGKGAGKKEDALREFWPGTPPVTPPVFTQHSANERSFPRRHYRSSNLLRSYFHADYAASVAPDNLLNSTGLHGPCER